MQLLISADILYVFYAIFSRDGRNEYSFSELYT